LTIVKRFASTDYRKTPITSSSLKTYRFSILFSLVTAWMARLGSRIKNAEAAPMLIVHVHVHVKPESVTDFRQATIENARSSVQEPGIARFDVVQQQDDTTRFLLIEVYRTPDAAAAHKETAHYAKWRDAVATMMAAPRQSVKYCTVFPDPQDW
jgi:(4S)-4-hydroxy-5-phosphonooxypentane-2,3-dione isomerase